jgi:hypothetical protein
LASGFLDDDDTSGAVDPPVRVVVLEAGVVIGSQWFDSIEKKQDVRRKRERKRKHSFFKTKLWTFKVHV